MLIWLLLWCHSTLKRMGFQEGIINMDHKKRWIFRFEGNHGWEWRENMFSCSNSCLFFPPAWNPAISRGRWCQSIITKTDVRNRGLIMSPLIIRTVTSLRKFLSNKEGSLKSPGGCYMKYFKLIFFVIVIDPMSSNLWAQEKLVYGWDDKISSMKCYPADWCRLWGRWAERIYP